jgi:DNA (cytosine-5)-methyltransferase 1
VVSDTLRNHPRPGSNSLGAITVAGAVTAKWAKGGGPAGDEAYNLTDTAVGVRRLTPLECERLQGWPDGWTRCTDDDRPLSDTTRYRLIGNGVVATVAEYIGRRLMAVNGKAK